MTIKLMEFTKKEIENEFCYVAKDIEVTIDNSTKKINILGRFHMDNSIAIILEDALTVEAIDSLSMNVHPVFLSNFKFDNQIIINHNIVDKLNNEYNNVIKELTDMDLQPVKAGDKDSFILTLKIDHFEKMVHFLETIKEG